VADSEKRRKESLKMINIWYKWLIGKEDDESFKRATEMTYFDNLSRDTDKKCPKEDRIAFAQEECLNPEDIVKYKPPKRSKEERAWRKKKKRERIKRAKKKVKMRPPILEMEFSKRKRKKVISEMYERTVMRKTTREVRVKVKTKWKLKVIWPFKKCLETILERCCQLVRELNLKRNKNPFREDLWLSKTESICLGCPAIGALGKGRIQTEPKEEYS
jgi:hypothetical protein